jgi:hypothetical protein
MPKDERLHFHDLRRDGVSRLFEMGKGIPQAASVSGHRSWQNLKRYTHLRHTGDKYADWKWRKPYMPTHRVIGVATGMGGAATVTGGGTKHVSGNGGSALRQP